MLTVHDNTIDQVLSISESNDIIIIMLSAEWMVMFLFLVQSVPMVRLECTDGALLREECSSSLSIIQRECMNHYQHNTMHAILACMHAVLKSLRKN